VAQVETRAEASGPRVARVEARTEASGPRMAWVEARAEASEPGGVRSGATGVEEKQDRTQGGNRDR
jgi:hypothetical protein